MEKCYILSVRYSDLVTLQQEIDCKQSFVCLILHKEGSERQRALSSLCRESPIIFSSDAFSKQLFLNEVETQSLFSGHKTVIVKDVDLLKDEEIKGIVSYIKNPSPWVSLFLTAADLSSPILKEVDAQAYIFSQKSQKPWEKEQSLADWLIHEAAREGVVLSLPTAQALVKAVDSAMLRPELDKLICYVGERQAITLEDMRAVSIPAHHETSWQLGDAILERNAVLAQRIGKILLQDGGAVFPLFAHLRTQMDSAIRALEALHSGGKEAVAKIFPYLKGNFLDKKLRMYQNYGLDRLQNALVHLFEAELKAKNSRIDQGLILEILLAKLTNDTLSSAKPAGTGSKTF